MRLGIRKAFGIIIILIGLFTLFQSLSILQGNTGNVVWSIILTGMSIFILTLFFSNKTHWWWLALGISLLGLTLSNFIHLTNLDDRYSEFFTLGGIGLGFFLIYLTNRLNWWAIIPGGLLISFAAITFLGIYIPQFESVGVVFLGLGITFVILFILPTPYGRLNWAIIPALVLLSIGIAISFGQDFGFLQYLGPGLILLAGLFILANAIRKR